MKPFTQKIIASIAVTAVSVCAVAIVLYTQQRNNPSFTASFPFAGTTTTTVRTTVNRTTTTTAPTTTTVPTTTTTNIYDALNIPDEDRTPGVTYFAPPTARADKSYFDNVVFIGDSVTAKLMFYNIATAELGNAQWLASSSLGLRNSLWALDDPDAVHPSYQGEKVTVPDGVAKTGCKKVYLMLGVNDLSWNSPEGAVNDLLTLTGNILAKTPDATFVIQSVTPMYKETPNLTNRKIDEYNLAVSELCREKGWQFLDVASVLRDDKGCLPKDYCSDPDTMGIHFTNVACQKWVEYLYTHAV